MKNPKVLFQRSIGKFKKYPRSMKLRKIDEKNLKIRKLKTDRIFQNGFVADYQGAGAGWRKQ